MTGNDILWDLILQQIKAELESRGENSESAMKIFEGSILTDIKDDNIFILAPNHFSYAALSSNNYNSIITEACKKFFKKESVLINISWPGMDAKKNIGIQDIEIAIEKDLNDFIQPNFTFDNFIDGPSNREAFVAAKAVAATPGKASANPLVIYGDSGLGKTHLLHAIGNYVKENNSDLKILYIPAENFVNEVVRSIKDDTIEEYKNQLKSLDFLLVDDIQNLSDKAKSGEVFFTIYNELFNNRKQIVLTSDRPPEKIKDIEERLKTRFSQGLSVTITSPEYETALRILKMKIKNHQIDDDLVTEDVLSYLACNCRSDVRKLEGVLNRLLFYSINFYPDTTIDLRIAEEAFKGQIIEAPQLSDAMDIKTITNVVCDFFNLTHSQLMSRNRTKNIATARHVSMYLCRKHLDVSYEKIGEEFGGMDHSTVLSGCAKIEKLVKTNEQYSIMIKQIEALLHQ